MRASVIIPVWNGRPYLADCLEAVLAQDCPAFEIIAVDNASVDGSAEFIEGRYPQVRVIRNRRNLGFAGGCNTGMRIAEGDFLVLLNQDTQMLPGWLRRMGMVLQDPQVGIVGGKALYPDKEMIQHAGGWIEWPLGLAHHYGQGERDAGQWDKPRSVDYVTGAAVAFRHDVLRKVGFLDEGFWPGYFEDADFCFRVREADFAVRYEPQAVVSHAETTSIKPSMVSRAYQRGRLRFVLKHMPPNRFLLEFVPAEKNYQPAAVRGQEDISLPLAYLASIPLTPGVYHQRWNTDEETVCQVVAVFRDLYLRSWEENWMHIQELSDAVLQSLPSDEVLSPDLSLEEFEFQSSMPIIGPLIAQLRSLWYSIAARWAMRHLAKQQDIVNRRQAVLTDVIDVHVHSLEHRVETLAAENVLLAEEIARIRLQIDTDEG
jgi:GT2 family glycosyltransferase